MAGLRVIIAYLVLAAGIYCATPSAKSDDVTLDLEPQLTGGFHLILAQGENRRTLGHIGRTLLSTTTSTQNGTNGEVLIEVNGATLRLNTIYDQENEARGIKIKWDTLGNVRLEDCFDFGSEHWYGGPMQLNQVYPIENAEQQYAASVSKENDNGAITERYWLNSAGEYIYVHPQVPLFIDYKNMLADSLCFGAQIADPYSSKRNHTELSYDLWLLPDVKAAHKHAVANYLGQPSGLPDYRMVQHPIWSTWAQYARDINQTSLLEYANAIREHGFNNSQFEIDDLWEVCYGSLTVDETRFPNMTSFVNELKGLEYRVTIWIHPFINKECDPWYSEALQNGYLILNEQGDPETNWWNNLGLGAGYIDFTNTAASEWFYQRVKSLIDTYGIDSLKFDAGESSFSPQIPVQSGDIDLHPHHIVESYVRTCARFGAMIEVRTGFRTQDLPIFVRMVDRDSAWGLDNGLATIITTTLQMNLNGYTLVLPDMIGGNGFNLDHENSGLPTKELFIRWVQANTFLPAMQYSFAPWNFDNETVEISKKYTELHAVYAQEIYAAMNKSVNEGNPVNAPLWWLDPTDEEALQIWDEYLLGEDILVAPILSANTTSRDIYLPKGVWLEEGDSTKAHEGPIWLRSFSAPLDTLPYFVRQQEPNSASTPRVAAILVLLALIRCF